MRKIEKIALTREVDTDAQLDYLGAFGNEPGKFPVPHEGGRNAYRYFNADNVENMKQARQNYRRMMEFENGSVSVYGVRAVAHILTSEAPGQAWTLNRIKSGGLWGIEGDSGDDYFKDVEAEQLDEVRGILAELGFTAEEIAAAEVIRED